MRRFLSYILVVLGLVAIFGCAQKKRSINLAGDERSLLSQAFEVSEGIQAIVNKEAAIMRIADVHSKAGRYDEAMQVIEALEEPTFRIVSLSLLTENAWKAGLEDKTLEILVKIEENVEEVKDEYFKVKALLLLSQNYHMTGQVYKRAEILSKVYREAKGQESPHLRSYSYTLIGEYFFKIGQRLRADNALSRAIEAAEELDRNDHVNALDMVAGIYANEGKYDKSLELVEDTGDIFTKQGGYERNADLYAAEGKFDNSVQTARLIEKPYTRAFALAGIAETAWLMDKKDTAREILAEAFHMGEIIEEPVNQSAVYERLAEAYMLIEDPTSAFEMVDLIHDAHVKASAQERIVDGYLKHGQTGPALSTAETIGGRYYNHRASALVKVAIALDKSGQKDKAMGAFDSALSNAKEMDDPFIKSVTLGLISEGFSKIGKFDKALEVINSMEAKAEREKAFYLMAYWYTEAGQYNKALLLTREIDDGYYIATIMTNVASKTMGSMIRFY